MNIPHWISSFAILVLMGGFFVFAFRQGMSVKPRRTDSKLWWQAVPPDAPDDSDESENDADNRSA